MSRRLSNLIPALAIAFSGVAAPDVVAQPIQRSQAEVRAFRAESPCPATGRRSGPCKGWAVDHVRPLCAGGEDKPSNMQWIENVDHRFKTLVDVKECKKMARMARMPAREQTKVTDAP